MRELKSKRQIFRIFHFFFGARPIVAFENATIGPLLWVGLWWHFPNAAIGRCKTKPYSSV